MTDETIDPEEALALAREATSTALEVASTAGAGSALARVTADASETKKVLGGAFSEITKARKTAAEKMQVARDAIEAQKRRLDQMERAMKAELEPLQEQLDRLSDGIASVNLYLGTDEELEEIRSGDSAPADEPIYIRQTVLAMDEETALLNDEGVGLDFRQLDVFIEWLLADDAHMQQVLPETKGVVTFMARSTPIDYTGEAISNAEINRANFKTHWLIRNGERVYLMTTAFSVGTLLIPTRREFTRLFEGLAPGSSEWLKAEKANDALTRHYMKVALILQGLVDRTAVFHPLPEGGVSLINDRDYDDRKVVLIEDDEKAIGTGRQPFPEWQAERIAQLEVGQRVVGSFPSPARGSRDEGTYTTPKYASAPQDNTPHVIHRQDLNNWYFAYDRTDTVDDYDTWGRYRGQKTPETRASYRIDKSQHSPRFIPVDTVTIEEMQEYLSARTERTAYSFMFPALTAAIAFKQQEEAAEEPFRNLLAQHVGGDERARELVSWYKHSAKWYRPLVGDGEAERKASKAILAEHSRRSKPVADGVVQTIRQAAPQAMAVARRTNDFVAVIPAHRGYTVDSAPQNVWVHLRFFTLTGKPIIRDSRDWATLSKVQVSKWTVLWQTIEFEEWQVNVIPGHHLPDPEIKRVVDEIIGWAEEDKGKRVAVATYKETAGQGWGSGLPKVKLYFESFIEETAHVTRQLKQPHMSFYLEVKNGAASFSTEHRKSTYLSSTEWRMEHTRKRTGSGFLDGFPDQTSPMAPQPPHTVNYSDSNPKSVVYRNDEVIADDAKLAAVWADKYNAYGIRQDGVQQVLAALERGWRRTELEGRRARFMADFGDPELWEDHSKSQKAAPFPGEDGSRSNALEEFAKAIVDTNTDYIGLTVADVLPKLKGRTFPGLLAEILPIPFDETVG